MFIKFVFRDVAWRPSELGACLIIDDPLLRPHYGFAISRSYAISCDKTGSLPTSPSFPGTGAVLLLPPPTSLEMSLGFSPYPFMAVITLPGSSGQLHVRSCTARPGWLNRECEIMRRKTGIQHDSIMIFPQGVFSSICPEVLKPQWLPCCREYRDGSGGLPKCTDSNQRCLGCRHHELWRLSHFHAKVCLSWFGELCLRSPLR